MKTGRDDQTKCDCCDKDDYHLGDEDDKASCVTAVSEDEFVRGDKAAEKLEKDLIKITDSKKKFFDKISKMGETFYKATKEWNTLKDDRVLSMMVISAGAEVEDLVEQEIDSILEEKDPLEKEKKLSDLLYEINVIPWLAEGFKVSIRIKIASARSGKLV